MMADHSGLTTALKGLLAEVEADLRDKCDQEELPWVKGLRAQYDKAFEVGRTAQTWTEWREGEIALAGVAWVLGTVFVRFCEDNRLIEGVWISGSRRRVALAMESETTFYAEDPSRDSQDWLRSAFAELARFPASRGLVDPDHSPVWSAPLGADACDAILRFWRQQDEEGDLLWPLVDSGWDTRFLGDIYQDLSQYAKDKFALLQTPVFVEEFILDRTLTPAIEQVPLADVNLIDPTCGSGHFLLGAFDRLLAAWQSQAPATDTRVRIQTVLDAVNGVDINPFAVAIARFRLVLAAIRAAGVSTLASAPAFRPRVAVADSLLAGDARYGTQMEILDPRYDALAVHRYAAEDVDQYPGILRRRTYQVVVGNPPYISVRDKALNAAYRQRFKTCKGKYVLTVPFMELFFDLAVRDGDGRIGGWVGQITSNSFMKREFGAKLIEDMLSGVDSQNPVDLLDVIDTSGAYIPWHGTPTVILIGRRRRPRSQTVHAVLGVRGLPGAPPDPRKGPVWSEIVDHIDDDDGYDGDYVTVTDLPRVTLAHHPWSLSGGGSGELKVMVDAAGTGTLGATADEIGIVGVVGEEEAFELPVRSVATGEVTSPGRPLMHVEFGGEPFVDLVNGEGIRDFQLVSTPHYWPYDATLEVAADADHSPYMWPRRRTVQGYLMFGKTRQQRGLEWFEYGMLAKAKLRTPLSIAYAEVATHNHFVLDRGGKVFKQTAPVIKLPADATLEDHLGLLAVLNSSVAGFWLRQVCFNKGGDKVGNSGARVVGEPWEDRYAFNSTNVSGFPLPAALPTGYGNLLDGLARKAGAGLPSAYLSSLNGASPTRAGLDAARAEYERLRGLMVTWQEELDWHCYQLYGLTDQDLTHVALDSHPTRPGSAESGTPAAPIGTIPSSDPDPAYDLAPASDSSLPPLELGQRAFEIVLALRMAAGEESSEWFARHGSTAITEMPSDWPAEYADLVRRRIAEIKANKAIRLLERPESKRRWAMKKDWDQQEAEALQEFVLDRLETPALWFGPGGPQTRTVTQIADAVRHDEALQAAIDLLSGKDADRVDVIAALMGQEAVPFLAAHRYKTMGLRKHAEWEAVWELQRREDAGERDLNIPVPPKYAQADFRKPSYWGLRGKLDVPKERFISYPGAERDNDMTATYGWAGWDHGHQALALLTLLETRADGDGWQVDRLMPLMAGLVELEPWLRQWHNEIDPEFGTSVSDDISDALQARLNAASVTSDDVRAWRPTENQRRRRRAT